MKTSPARSTADNYHRAFVIHRRRRLEQAVVICSVLVCFAQLLIRRYARQWSVHRNNLRRDDATYFGQETPVHKTLKDIAFGDDLRTYLLLANDARAAFGMAPPDYQISPGAAPLTVAQYSNVYGPSQIWSDSERRFESCSMTCKTVGDYGDSTAAQEADVVIINMQSFSLSSTPWVRPQNQLWVGVYFESMGNYPLRGGEEVLQHFNYTMGYRPDADFPIFAMVYDTFKQYPAVRDLALPDWESKTRPDQPHLSTWISNCNTETTGRMRILSELASTNITIASYGRCQNTHSVRLENLTADGQWEELGRKGDGEALVAMASQHLFFYAAENSACAYYITEKVFHGLLAGSVPIYVGDSAHLKAIAPTDSIIYTDDFPDTRELGNYLHALIGTPEAYKKHLVWRDDPRSLDKLQKLLNMSEWERNSPAKLNCALCEFLTHRPRRTNPISDMCS